MTFSIPYTNLSSQTAEIKTELLSAVEAVLDSGNYILGPNVLEFEKKFASYCHAKYGVGVANGTSSLYLVLKAIGVKEGDEVITAPNSFISSASSIALTGAKPVFADISEDMNIDPLKIESAITPHTKAIIPVHLTGRPAQMDEIMRISQKYNLFYNKHRIINAENENIEDIESDDNENNLYACRANVFPPAILIFFKIIS